MSLLWLMPTVTFRFHSATCYIRKNIRSIIIVCSLIQNEWVVCNGGEKAAYTNLPAGDYVFEVKSVYPDGTDSVVNTLAIRILPHWSQTIWFRLCVLLVILLITGYAVHRVRREQRRAKRELLLKHELHISNMEREQEKQIREEREASLPVWLMSCGLR